MTENLVRDSRDENIARASWPTSLAKNKTKQNKKANKYERSCLREIRQREHNREEYPLSPQRHMSSHMHTCIYHTHTHTHNRQGLDTLLTVSPMSASTMQTVTQ